MVRAPLLHTAHSPLCVMGRGAEKLYVWSNRVHGEKLPRPGKTNLQADRLTEEIDSGYIKKI